MLEHLEGAAGGGAGVRLTKRHGPCEAAGKRLDQPPLEELHVPRLFVHLGGDEELLLDPAVASEPELQGGQLVGDAALADAEARDQPQQQPPLVVGEGQPRPRKTAASSDRAEPA